MEVVMLEELSVRTSDELDDATALLDSITELLDTARVLWANMDVSRTILCTGLACYSGDL